MRDVGEYRGIKNVIVRWLKIDLEVKETIKHMVEGQSVVGSMYSVFIT